MYNLFVCGSSESWDGEPWTVEDTRCVNEYTDATIKEKYGLFDSKGNFRADSVAELKQLPCIFAYEAWNKKTPRFGIIRDVVARQNKVRVEYEIKPLSPFLTHEELGELMFELDIGDWELNRTHWAVKDVNLARELKPKGITLPSWTRSARSAVDISKHVFDVALSFPGETRQIVESIAQALEHIIGPNSYFYDNNYVAQLARPSLDTLLQDIYRNRSKLVVVFLSSDYQNKEWCGIEFRAVKDIIKTRGYDKIMLVRTDDGVVDGVFDTDGYVDSRRYTPEQIADFIKERVDLIVK